MDMLTTDISSLGYKAVKEKVDKIDVNEVHNSEDLIKIIDILKADKRKNINSLGNKLQRAKDKIESEIKRVREMYNFDKSFGAYGDKNNPKYLFNNVEHHDFFHVLYQYFICSYIPFIDVIFWFLGSIW